jgi:hypothetical protein
MRNIRVMFRGKAVMIQARVHAGRLEIQEPIPEEWEGQLVKVSPMTPDDPLPDLEERLAALHAMGPMEFEPDERERIVAALADLNNLSQFEPVTHLKTESWL